MDVVASLNDTAIPVVLQPTVQAFVKLLEKRRAEIEGITRKTFRYGEAERHNLDVYYPPAEAISSGSVPVLFFVYGGGFSNGTRKFDPPADLGYCNVGAFFAKRGILTVIPDYRLVPHVKFPEPAEDVRDALAWFLSNTSPVAASAPSSITLANPEIFVMGHSAGAHLITSLFFLPSILPLSSPIRAATRGLIPQGGAFKFDFSKPLLAPGTLEQLYGSQEKALELMPVALVAKADEELVKSLPDVFVLVSELDPEPIKEGCDEFVKGLEGRLGKSVKYEVMKGHNHISPHWALLSGEGEEWGVQVADWIKSKV
ncbi:alpha/beta hydrolase domain-containing protein [Pilatotrama ljubarskyi]|nr:alpha/beta hydrolase domain-containing protein [Pilatotrama ljubarskyi]